MIVDKVIPHQECETLFLCDDEGANVCPTPNAEAMAKFILGLVDTADTIHELEWKLPNVFDIRYGSGYIGTATHGANSVRFHHDLGEFREGDDK